MNIKVENFNKKDIKVGSIIEVNHLDSKNECPFYLVSICAEGYFILNLSGQKSGYINYYNSLAFLLERNESSIVRVYSNEAWELKLVNMKKEV